MLYALVVPRRARGGQQVSAAQSDNGSDLRVAREDLQAEDGALPPLRQHRLVIRDYWEGVKCESGTGFRFILVRSISTKDQILGTGVLAEGTSLNFAVGVRLQVKRGPGTPGRITGMHHRGGGDLTCKQRGKVCGRHSGACNGYPRHTIAMRSGARDFVPVGDNHRVESVTKNCR
ncbi:hypothetical protein LF1_58000 [Rubripirellula obstinata]|uniref:Uncharacterized protein n=1 Tax=Rubripirellula obstinata TaxID=406547 RepID=A0A5B1C9N0_9BACT|nr:hypothetical protein LF1_58000 [Rubripirellula obstinata]